MNFVQCLSLVLLTAAVLVGSLMLMQISSTGRMSGNALHSSMSHADYGERVSEEIRQSGHGKDCNACESAAAVACMMTFCHPAVIIGNVCLAAPGCERKRVPDPGFNQSEIALEIITPPPRHHL